MACQTNIFPASSVPIWRGTLDHFAEGQGEHYVLLNKSEEHISPISLGNSTSKTSVLEKKTERDMTRHQSENRIPSGMNNRTQELTSKFQVMEFLFLSTL